MISFDEAYMLHTYKLPDSYPEFDIIQGFFFGILRIVQFCGLNRLYLFNEGREFYGKILSWI